MDTPQDIWSALTGPSPFPVAQPGAPEQIGFTGLPDAARARGGDPTSGISPDITVPRTQQSHVRIGARLISEARSDLAVLEYPENVPVFVLNAKKQMSMGVVQNVYSLNHLNHMIRAATAHKRRQLDAESARPLSGAKRRYVDCNPELSAFPTTLDAVRDSVTYAGWLVAATEQDPNQNKRHFTATRRTMATQLQGLATNRPNLWGDKIFPSAVLAFAIKRVRWTGNLTDWRGEGLDEQASAASDVVQIVPVLSNMGGAPVGATSHYGPSRDTDNDSFEEVAVEMGGEGVIDAQTLIFTDYKPAYLIQVGTVARSTSRFPSEMETEKAMYTQNGLFHIMQNSMFVDIDLTQNNWRMVS